ncbi:MAG TPA: hypothetical protein VKZ53_14570 [Candidatus Angelobacter sp.]|nr:hypothetical protein [Candidatus Angelobacter sp.]
MSRLALVLGFTLVITAVLTGCYGHGTVTTPKPTITVSPSFVSLSPGDVIQVSANPAAVTWTSSNPSLVTVSPAGLVCGGIWDSLFIVCSPGKVLTTAGTPVNIFASDQGVTSNPVAVTLHPKVTSVSEADLGAGPCTSTTLTRQFQAHAFDNGVEIPSDEVGSFSWVSDLAQVASVDVNGLATAHSPGTTGLSASISASGATIFGPAIGFRTCMPIEIRLHVPGDTPGNLTTSTTFADPRISPTPTPLTVTVQADLSDENGFASGSDPSLTIISTNPAVATIVGTTITAISPGGTSFVATCTPPACGGGLNLPVYGNLFRVTVTGTSPATTVFATSSFAPPSGTTPTLIPIDTSKTPPVAGTVINLPGVPNSLVLSADGLTGFMGTNNGLTLFDPVNLNATVVQPTVLGKVLAVSRDGATAIVSNVNIQTDPTKQEFFVYHKGTNTFQTFVVPGAVAATFDTDGFRAYIVANNGNVYVFSDNLSLATFNTGGSSTSVAGLSSDPFVYVANSGGLQALSTCNNQLQTGANVPLPASSGAIQLVGGFAGADVMVAVGQTGVNIDTVKAGSILSTNPTLPFNLTTTNCTPPVTYSNQFVDFGLGTFTARQLLVSSVDPASGAGATNPSHIVVIPAGLNKILTALPGAANGGVIPLAGAGTEALGGGMTLDGNVIWVGVAGTNTVDEINLNGSSDVAQVTTSFKKADGTAAPPDIVVVRPQ